MVRHWFFLFTAGLMLVTMVNPLLGGQGDRASTPNPDANRETIETFRKLLLKQLSLPHHTSRGDAAEDLFNAVAGNPHLVYDTYQPAPVQPRANYGAANNPFDSNAGQPGNKPGPLPRSGENPLDRFFQVGQPANHRLVTTAASVNSVEGSPVPGGVLFLGTVRAIPAGDAGKQLTCSQCHGNKVPGKVDAPSPVNQADAEWSAAQGTAAPAKSQPAAKAPAAAPQFCQPSLLAERLVQLLADHGHHFSGFGSTDRITIQLHVRLEEQVMARGIEGLFDQIANPAPADGGVVVFRYPTYDGNVTNAADDYMKRNLGANPAEKASDPLAQRDANTPNAEANSFVRRQNALAELHTKEGSFDKALEAYKQIIDSKYALDLEDRAEAYRHLAEVLIKQKKADQAHAALTKWRETVVEARHVRDQAAKKKSAPETAVRSASSHWTLTVSATKHECDAVRAGTLSLEEFAKKVEVKSSR